MDARATLSPVNAGQATDCRSVEGATTPHPASASEAVQVARRAKVIVVLSVADSHGQA